MFKGLEGGLLCALLCLGALTAPAGAGASLLAPPQKCEDARDHGAKEHRQEVAMLCLINHARDQAGVGKVRAHEELARAAGEKATDIKRCGFSHTACGRPSDYWPKRTGYVSGGSWVVGENIAWGKGWRGSARHVMERWLESPSHREVLLMGRFEHSGLGLQTDGGTAFWVLELGST